ncbi:MAG: glycine--tRNA ligase subunit beta [Pseudomonadota bacterium]
MISKKDLLIEIGTEEMPPSTLKRLAEAFCSETANALENYQLDYEIINWYATPRRLALIIQQLDCAQKDIEQERRGPAVGVAFDESGNPTKATEGFARSCGVSVDELGELETDKGKWLSFISPIKGKQTSELIPNIVETALSKLPIAKRMRWGDSNIEFVRPIKWLLFLFDDEVLECETMGMTSGSVSYGHRFHHPQPIVINSVGTYIQQLKDVGKVIVDYIERREFISVETDKLAKKEKGKALIDDDLLDEVTSLVEWPVVFTGTFDDSFLTLPKEVLIATMQDHQKYFPIIDKKNNLIPMFIAVSNIESQSLSLIRQGNERVIQPRLSDAAFFFERDKATGLSNKIEKLKDVIFQKKLGSLYDRKERIKQHANNLSLMIEVDKQDVNKAADLCLCDLLTEMVYEFPELQGVMGNYYAQAMGEKNEVSQALQEFYLPRFAGDSLPVTSIGQCLSIAGKADSLIGIFAIGQAPTGTKDPFALRRAAIGLLRIIIENQLDIDLTELFQEAAKAFPEEIAAKNAVGDLLKFMQERLRRYYLDQGIDQDVISAVLAVYNNRPLDCHYRLNAVTAFRQHEASQSLAAANKRIANILKKNKDIVLHQIDSELLTEQAEKNLANKLTDYQSNITPLIQNKDYEEALALLAGLKNNIDDFFDNVMVMADDESIRNNRLTLLKKLHTLFIQIADISKLQA